MDVDTRRCLLQFLGIHPRVSDGMLSVALEILSLHDEDLFLAKAVVLRSIRSEIYEASISEKLLEYIEVVEEIDRRMDIPIEEAMKEAYCTVAVECCVRYIHGSRLLKLGKFVEAVRRIWMGRIRVMASSAMKSELLTPKLLRWGCQIEAAVGDKSECLNLMMINTRAAAFRAIQDYVTDALVKMRDMFLESLVARSRHGLHSDAREAVSFADDAAESAGQPGAQVSQQEQSILPGHGEEIGFADHRTESDTHASQLEIGFAEDKAESAGQADAQVSQLERAILPGHGEDIGLADHRAEPDTRASQQEIGFAEDKSEPAGQANAQVSQLEQSILPGHAEEIDFTDLKADSDTRASQHEQYASLELGNGELKEPSEDSVKDLVGNAERLTLSSRKRRAASSNVPRRSTRIQKKRGSTEEGDALGRRVERFRKVI